MKLKLDELRKSKDEPRLENEYIPAPTKIEPVSEQFTVPKHIPEFSESPSKRKDQEPSVGPEDFTPGKLQLELVPRDVEIKEKTQKQLEYDEMDDMAMTANHFQGPMITNNMVTDQDAVSARKTYRDELERPKVMASPAQYKSEPAPPEQPQAISSPLDLEQDEDESVEPKNPKLGQVEELSLPANTQSEQPVVALQPSSNPKPPVSTTTRLLLKPRVSLKPTTTPPVLATPPIVTNTTTTAKQISTTNNSKQTKEQTGDWQLSARGTNKRVAEDPADGWDLDA